MFDKLTKLKFEVKVPKNFKNAVDEGILSESFSIISAKSKKKTQWQLMLNWRDQEDPMIFIGIKRISDKIDFDIFVIFAFEKVEEIPGSELESKYIFLSKNKWNNSKDGSKVVGYGKHYSHEEFEQNKESYFPDGVLSFKVNIFAHNHEVLGFDGTNPSHMSKVFEDIFTHMKHSDVTIVTSDETLRAHSVILSARSKVFDNELTEVKELNAKEFSSKIMKMILKFIYTNKLDEIDYIDKHEIYELFHAAKKFGIVKDFLNVNAEKIQGKLKNPIELICLFVEFGQVPDEILNSSALVISENPKSLEIAEWKELKHDVKLKILEISVKHNHLATQKLKRMHDEIDSNHEIDVNDNHSKRSCLNPHESEYSNLENVSSFAMPSPKVTKHSSTSTPVTEPIEQKSSQSLFYSEKSSTSILSRISSQESAELVIDESEKDDFVEIKPMSPQSNNISYEKLNENLTF